MLPNTKKRSNASSRGDNIDSTSEVHPYQNYSLNDSYNHESSFATPSENEDDFESAVNDHGPRLTETWSSPFTMKKDWNHSGAVPKESMLPPIKIRGKNKVKKLKRKESRSDSTNCNNDLSNQHDNNILKTRLKLGPKGYSSSKKLKSKQKTKLDTSFRSTSLNGTNSANSDVDNKYYENNSAPNELSTHVETGVYARLKAEDYNGDGEDAEYPQYLVLEPLIRFKCSRCGERDFSTMTLLQEHMANCDGHFIKTVTTNPLSQRSTSVCESLQHSSVARNLKIKRKVLLCSSCGTYYQHYNLYIHMHEKHNKQICLFCRNTFTRPEQLWDHLIVTHNLNSVTYSTATQVRDVFKSFYITCCACNSVFSDQDKFDEHNCEVDTDLPKNESYCSSCRPVDPHELNSDTGDVIDRSPVKRSIEGNAEDSSYPEDESLSMSSQLAVIGVLEKHAVTSCMDEMETSHVTDMSNMKLIEHASQYHDSASEKTLKHKVISEAEESIETAPVNDEVKEEIKSHDARKPAEDVSDEVKNQLYESNDGETLQLQDETHMITPVSSVENNIEPTLNKVAEPLIEHAINEDLTTKVEESVLNWLDSDDENTNTPVQHPAQMEPVKQELSPQPVTLALMLDETVASLSVETVIKECVRTSSSTCLYCNNATMISVNSSQLAAHLRSEHRFMPTKLEDNPEEVTKKLDEGILDPKMAHMNAALTSSSVEFNGTFSCLQCTFCTSVFKDLCHHKRKLHHKVIFLCIMCKCNFLHYSQLLCHLCPGQYSTDAQHTLTYHCCFCNIDTIPSAFRLMVHLRKMHKACDICLIRCNTQSELFSHMIKQHKINHVCYKCNLAYRSRDGINEHLFWKHGTESVVCKRCLLKKWPHAYHFCIPAATYTCDECSRSFGKPAALTVHRRAHNGYFPSACTDCDQRFISKKLLAVHRSDTHGIKLIQSEADVPKDELNHQEAAVKASAITNSEDNKKGRKKKRKKGKTDIEKPLLDELPPLNLSSESEDDSVDEGRVIPAADPPATPQSPVQENSVSIPVEDTPVVLPPEREKTEDITETFEPAQLVNEKAEPSELPAAADQRQEEDSVACDPIPSEELFPEVTLLERMKNCLVIEHSYCLPDSIFRSAGPATTQGTAYSSFDTVCHKLSSPKSGLKSRDKPACKSVTTHKRKRPLKRDSSSSDTSSDSDSSSSSCGSNCSCNQKTNSNCSSSSSGSEYSTTPDKNKNAKTSAVSSKADLLLTNEEDEYQREHYSLLNARESDLDTDIITSDEEFYDKHPTSVPPPVESRLELPIPVAPPPVEPYATSKKALRGRKNRKRRRAPKITINLGSQPNSNFSINLQRVDNDMISDTTNSSYRTFVPRIAPSNQMSSFAATSTSSTPNIISNNVSPRTFMSSTDSKGRRSKRERVKNRFYGYSSDDEASGGGDGVGGGSGNDSLKLVIGKSKPAVKRPSKSKLPFVGIRAKKPLIMALKRPPPPTTMLQPVTNLTNSMSATHQSLPAHVYRMPSYIMQRQQQQQQQHQSYYSKMSTYSSDDSDSDNLVINEPSLIERNVNSQPPEGSRFVAGPPLSSTSNYLPRPNGPPLHSIPGPPMAVGSEVKLYCYCRCPYDEVSEMIGCDGKQCKIEWFHFECVGIMVPPKGQWYCPECRKNREGFPSQLV